MKMITRKQFMGDMAATVALGWRGAFAAPARRQRNYDDMTWWDPYVEDITDTYLRRKFRQDVTDEATCPTRALKLYGKPIKKGQ
jgi:hypothetical protein